MTRSPLFVEVDWSSRTKTGQSICGDAIVARKYPDQQRHIVVMSDGLGSGVKANILSTMTATMAAKFIHANMVNAESLNVMMDALPICNIRKISYATFTIVDTSLDGRTRLIEMGNPPALHIRDGHLQEYAYEQIAEPGRPDRDIRKSDMQIRPGDRLVFFSDGITQAGIGSENHKLGLRLKGCSDYILDQLQQTPDMSAHTLANRIVQYALMHEPDRIPHDDMTCVVIYYRRPRKLLLMTGPPYKESDDRIWAQKLLAYPGEKIVCGGTTANILSRELKLPIHTSLRPAGGLPGCSAMNGVDLTTEGILTLTRVCSLLERNERDDSPATMIIDRLKNHDMIEFCVGTKINEAHQDPTLPADLDIRRNIIKRMATLLEEKYLKEVRIQYI